MATWRKSGPLRETDNMDIQDGTMCRMTSPLPGPLHGQSDTTQVKENTLAENFSLQKVPAIGLSSRANDANTNGSNIELPIETEKVA